jgi:hypothetical protein
MDLAKPRSPVYLLFFFFFLVALVELVCFGWSFLLELDVEESGGMI